MSESSTDELHWRETYFIVFPDDRRPTLQQVEAVLEDAGGELRLKNLAADDDGYFQSVFVESTQDHAAVEVSYETGEPVIEQNLQWAKELQKQLPAQQLQQLMTSNARLDVAHFERLPEGANPAPPKASSDPDAAFFADDDFGGGGFGDGDDMLPDMLDPTCLLTVVEALSGLTEGLTFDPAAGELME
ncbi:MAG: hypothetical protein AAGA92_15070 [Planctomycetota bacterium]